VVVRWEPFLLGPIFEAFGWKSSPFVLQKEKGAYVWKDMERQCRKYGLPWRKPSVFPQNTVLPMRVALHGAGAPWGPPFCRAMMLRNWGTDEDIASAESVRAVLGSLGLPAASLLAEVQEATNKPRLRAQVERARARDLRGADVLRARRDVLGQRPARTRSTREEENGVE
jgi:2-hydroxychromene-2-carboxylate isomerase